MYKISKNRALNILGLEYENFIHKLAEGEGSTMTFAQTSATINNLPVNNVRPKDVLVVKCIQNGVDYVMDLLRKDDLFFDKQTLKMINRYVASNDNFDNFAIFKTSSLVSAIFPPKLNINILFLHLLILYIYLLVNLLMITHQFFLFLTLKLYIQISLSFF